MRKQEFTVVLLCVCASVCVFTRINLAEDKCLLAIMHVFLDFDSCICFELGLFLLAAKAVVLLLLKTVLSLMIVQSDSEV